MRPNPSCLFEHHEGLFEHREVTSSAKVLKQISGSILRDSGLGDSALGGSGWVDQDGVAQHWVAGDWVAGDWVAGDEL